MGLVSAVKTLEAMAKKQSRARIRYRSVIEEDRETDTVNIKFFNSYSKRPGIIAKLKTSSYQHSAKIDTGTITNILSFCVYKILSPRSANKLLS